MSNLIKIRIDGKTVTTPAGTTILEAVRQEGIYIPTLCHSPLLHPLENCRLCVVSVVGESKYKAACSTYVTEGMDITTQSEELRQTRKLLLELLLDTHYGDCVAPCSVACPANVDIQGYLALIRQGEYREAVRLIKEKIPMPATIGRVCPHPCEQVCRRHLVEDPININHCKRFLADFEMNGNERVLPSVPPPSGRRVAIVGGGPAGLSAAYYLRSLGHGATIFEANDKLGGMLRYGIPEYRLPKKVLDWEIDGILSLGVEVKTGVRWGRDYTLDDLKKEGFDAVFLAIGAWSARKLGIVGEELPGVIRGVDFLYQIAANGSGKVMVGKNVVVIGGGNVAIDAARSALRLGSEKVTILYRRSRKEMPASHEEIEAAQAEGVDIQFLVAPVKLFSDNGNLDRLQFIRMELGEPDASGRRRPVPLEGSEAILEADQVISAIGQFPEVLLPEADSAMADLPLTRWSTIGGDPRSMYTGREMIFVGGDVFRGPDTVVAALADGRKAAYSLNRSFLAGEVQPEPLHFNISKGDLETIDREPFSVLKTIGREAMPEMTVAERGHNFQEVELGFNEEQVQREAGRCLVCGCSAAFDCRLRELMNEFQVDWRDQPSKKIHYQRVAAVDVHPDIALDPNKCVRCERCYVGCETFQISYAIEFKDWPRFNDNCVHCGLCVDLCPTGALMERWQGRAVERLSWQTVTSHCVHCGCGCQLELRRDGERLIWSSDGSRVPPNWASTCRRGRFRSYDDEWYGERVLQPLLRQNGQLREVSWEKAIGVLLSTFDGLAEKYGADALGALGSPRASNEALYLLQKWLRVGWKSHAVDFPGRELLARIWTGMSRYEILQRLQVDLAALERVHAILVCGDGVEAAAPLVATMLRRTGRKVPVCQLASRPDELTPFAAVAAHAAPETWPQLLRYLTRSLLEAGNVPEAIRQKIPVETASSAKNFNPGDFGIAADQWQLLLQGLLSAPSVAFVFPENLFGGPPTADAADSLLELAAATGYVKGEGNLGVYPLTAEINANGALLMGVTPEWMPGCKDLSVESTRKQFADIWQVPDLPREPGRAVESALQAGLIKGLFLQQAAALWRKDPDRWANLLQQAEFVVLQEISPGPAMDRADLVLPAASYGEQGGTVLNLERRVLNLVPALQPRGRSLADWEILSQIMAAQGIPFPRDMAAIQEEIKQLVENVDWSLG